MPYITSARLLVTITPGHVYAVNQLLQQQQQAQRQRNAEQLAAERAKLKTACRKKIGSPSAQAGQFTWPVYRYSCTCSHTQHLHLCQC